MTTRGLLTLAAAAVLLGGYLLAAAEHISLWHGIYCSLGTAATVGCDVTPSTGWAQAVSVAVILIAIPALAAVFGRLTADHLGRAVRRHVGEDAAAARRIMADLHKQLTGRDHPDAPGGGHG